MWLTLMLVAFVTLMGVTTGQDDMTTDNYRSIQTELADMRQQMAADRREAEGTKLQMTADRREAEEVKLSLTTLTAVNEEQTRAVDGLKAANDQLIATVDELTGVNVVLTADVAGLKQDIARIDFRHDEDPVQVAFSVVSHTHFGPVSEDTNIPFESVHTNVGDGWYSETNLFLAPVDGIYEFTASVASPGTGVYALCYIVKISLSAGKTNIASMMDYTGSYTSSSNTVIIPLLQGEAMSVQLRGDGSGRIYSSSAEIYSSFSGFLLFR